VGPIDFDKYEALGNDFIVVDARTLADTEGASLARSICERRTGVGADGLLWLVPGDETHRVSVFNADGGLAETSGNGLRCAARWLLDRGFAATGADIPLVSGAGASPARVTGDEIAVSMGPPSFRAPDLPEPGAGELTSVELLAGGAAWSGVAVSMGNPHLVVRAGADPANAPLQAIADAAEEQGGFPRGVNVELAHVTARSRVDARVWERGVGETRACGSGACAVVAALRIGGAVGAEVDVQMPGGRLRVTWSGNNEESMWLTGPAQRVFSGRYLR
jgi:diaminopimelate epimerase